MPPPPLVRPSSEFCGLITAALEPPIGLIWLSARPRFTRVFAIPVVVLAALVLEACRADDVTLCANAAGLPTISNAAVEIKRNLCMVGSSLPLVPRLAGVMAQIPQPQKNDVFPFGDSKKIGNQTCVPRLLLSAKQHGPAGSAEPAG
jgi:hypothetical protein